MVFGSLCGGAGLMGWAEPRMVAASPAAVAARVGCAKYLDERIQDKPEQKRGRKPDMGPAAAKALKEVLWEVATKTTSRSPALTRSLTGASGVLGGLPTRALAHELESMARQLKLSGETTPRQLHDVQAQLDLVGGKQRGDDKVKEGVTTVTEPSRACLLM